MTISSFRRVRCTVSVNFVIVTIVDYVQIGLLRIYRMPIEIKTTLLIITFIRHKVSTNKKDTG